MVVVVVDTVVFDVVVTVAFVDCEAVVEVTVCAVTDEDVTGAFVVVTTVVVTVLVVTVLDVEVFFGGFVVLLFAVVFFVDVVDFVGVSDDEDRVVEPADGSVDGVPAPCSVHELKDKEIKTVNESTNHRIIKVWIRFFITFYLSFPYVISPDSHAEIGNGVNDSASPEISFKVMPSTVPFTACGMDGPCRCP